MRGAPGRARPLALTAVPVTHSGQQDFPDFVAPHHGLFALCMEAGDPAGLQDDARWQAGDVEPTPEPEQYRRSVLVAMGDGATRWALAELLAMEGHEVRQAANGAAALRSVALARPDVVVADACSPRLDGPVLARSLQECDMPVVLLGPEETVAPQDGVISLPKPIDVTRLLALMPRFPPGRRADGSKARLESSGRVGTASAIRRDSVR